MIRLGVLCPAEIALRRFMPALKNSSGFEFAGIGVYRAEERFGLNLPEQEVINKTLQNEYDKAQKFVDTYGGKIYEGYENMLDCSGIDAIYIPLPPALHYKWAKLALLNEKHVLVEKPSTTFLKNTQELIQIAGKKQLGLHENYMFAFHNQIKAVKDIVARGDIGDVRLYRISFGFPKREQYDFRYNKELGGGALIDAGGYCLKYASMLLGKSAKSVYAMSNYMSEYDVDLYGSGALVNASGTTVQLAFGMDNNYKCELEVWGSKGCLTTNRILTAPTGFIPEAVIKNGNNETVVKLPEDDSFKKSIQYFYDCIYDETVREESYRNIYEQSLRVEEFKELAGLVL